MYIKFCMLEYSVNILQIRWLCCEFSVVECGQKISLLLLLLIWYRYCVPSLFKVLLTVIVSTLRYSLAINDDLLEPNLVIVWAFHF